jgi:mobilization protein NikA
MAGTYCGFGIRYASNVAKARAMKVTTVRFSEDLWEAIAAEAERAGVSASQFIREAALARAAGAAGARGEFLFEAFGPAMHEAVRPDLMPSERQREIQAAISGVTRALAADTRSDAQALRAQSQQATRFAHELRDRRPVRRAKRST